MNPRWRSCWFVETSMYLSVPAGRQAGRQACRAGAAVLYPQAASLLLGPLEPVTLWTWAQEKAERESGGVGSLVPGVPSLCTGEEKVELWLPTLLTLQQSGRIQNLSSKTSVTQLRWLLPQLLIWAEATCHGVVCLRRSLCVCVCVVGNVGSVHQLEGAENCCLLPLDCLD